MSLKSPLATLKQVLPRCRQSFGRDLQGVTAQRSCPHILAQVPQDGVGQPREVSRYILIRNAAEIWKTS